MVGHGTRLPREVVTAPSLSEFEECLDDALSADGLVLGSPARSRELDSMSLMGPFQLEMFYDCMIVSPTGLPADPAGSDRSGKDNMETGARACESSS